MRVQLSAAARRDLARLWSYRSDYSVGSADALLRELDAAFEMLSEAPRAGRAMEELGPGIRTLVRAGHVIIYRPESQQLRVLRVVDGREDWRQEF